MIELVFAQEADGHSTLSLARREPPARCVDFYLTRGRTQIQSEFQYRVATYFWLIGMIAEPVVYLVVWTTIADQHGG